MDLENESARTWKRAQSVVGDTQYWGINDKGRPPKEYRSRLKHKAKQRGIYLFFGGRIDMLKTSGPLMAGSASSSRIKSI
jgi:hypothetical protein